MSNSTVSIEDVKKYPLDSNFLIVARCVFCWYVLTILPVNVFANLMYTQFRISLWFLIYILHRPRLKKLFKTITLVQKRLSWGTYGHVGYKLLIQTNVLRTSENEIIKDKMCLKEILKLYFWVWKNSHLVLQQCY